MNIFARYLRRELLRGYLLSALVMVGLFSLITLADELDNVGKGDYQMADALVFTLFSVPKQSYDLLPVIILLGTVFALGMLAGSGQLIAIRALGASVKNLLLIVVKTALMIIGVALVLAQLGIPQLEERAYTMRSERMSADSSALGEQGMWARDGMRFINIREFDLGRIPRDISIYNFSANQGLMSYMHAETAQIQDNKQWLLEHVWVKEVAPGQNTASFQEQLVWSSFLEGKQIGILSIPPESLSPLDLFNYINSLRSRGQASERYQLALWQQLSVPVAALLMALLAVPVATGSNRISTAGKRIMQSSAVGLLFYLFSSAITYLGLLANASPVLTSFGPLLLLAVAAWLMLRKLR